MKKEEFLACVIKFIVCFGLLSSSIELYAQDELDQKSSTELRQLAKAAERIHDLSSAAIYYQAYLDKNPKKHKVRFRLGEIYRNIGANQKAKALFQNVWEAHGKKYPLSQFYYAEMLKKSGDCEKAIPIFKDFRRNYLGEKFDRKYRRLAKFNIRGCENLNIKKEDKDSVYVKVTLLPKPINGEHIEASPLYLEDDLLLYNSLKSDGQMVFDVNATLPQRQFYLAQENEDGWKAKGLWKKSPKIAGKELANGAFNFDRSRFYFSACERNNLGEVDCDIYKVERHGSSWSSPEKLADAVNSKYTETQVAVGLDEKGRETIYFVSDRKGGKGGLDIWYSTYYEKKDKYRKARNCGSKVNSVGDEMTPFVNPQDGILYFSSDGHPGFGGLDVFYTTGQRSRWDEIDNLGKEINSTADELYYMRHESMDKGYFVSNRKRKDKKKYCCDDLYFYEELGKVKLFVSGTVSASDESGDTASIDNAELVLYQLSKDGTERFYQKRINTTANGKYTIRLNPDKSYRLRVAKDGYLAKELELNTYKKYKDQSIEKNISLETVKERVFNIEGINYDYDSFELTEEAKATIDSTLYQVLLANPSMVIELSSHTDSIGTKAYNMKLSQKRAQRVVTYLKAKGIDKKRLKAKGYGESKPIAPNSLPDGSDNPEGRKKNRRTEFKVIGELELDEDLD